MTIEEAIKHFEAQAECNYAPTRETAQMAIAAIRTQWPPLDRSRWKGCECCNERRCKTCRNVCAAGMPCVTCHNHSRYKAKPYCSTCGRPLTEEAWAELERRINGGKIDNAKR